MPVVFLADTGTIGPVSKKPGMKDPTAAYSADQRRRAMNAFIEDHEVQIQTWTKLSGEMRESVVRRFLIGKVASLTDRTYERLAAGASLLIGRKVTAGELRGDRPQPWLVPVTARIGAGETVIPIDTDSPIDSEYTQAPIFDDVTEAWEVDGDSMRPLYGPKDKLFPGRPAADPTSMIGRIVGAQLRDGRRLVKTLQRGSRKGRFNLASINPAHPLLEDVAIDFVVPIRAAIYSI